MDKDSAVILFTECESRFTNPQLVTLLKQIFVKNIGPIELQSLTLKLHFERNMISTLLELQTRFSVGKGENEKTNALNDKFNSVFNRDFNAYLKSLSSEDPLANILVTIQPIYN